jgi:hypothetical protein
MTSLILRRAPIGDNEDDYDVLENGVVVGRIFFLDAVGPQDRPWMWTSGQSGTCTTATRLTLKVNSFMRAPSLWPRRAA